MRHWFLLLLSLAGCATHQGGTGAAQAINKPGVIESVSSIEMDASSNAGSMAGSIFGQVGGANTGAGRGAVVGSIFGSVLGGTLGQSAGINSRQGLELWVKLDGDEQSTYVMQPGKPDAFRIGDRVRVTRKNGELRVEPDLQPAGQTH